jgi:UDP-N-acetylmuramyl pentapeptide phosphotransferase/UDP-N-acetylglucosamine-1-phosphate transferase
MQTGWYYAHETIDVPYGLWDHVWPQMTDDKGLLGLALVLGATGVVSAWITARLMKPEARIRILDKPNERSLHARAIPRTGGLGILLGFAFGLAACLVALWAGLASGILAAAARGLLQRDVLAIIVAVLVVGGMSFWSDRRHVSPLLRFITHVVAGTGLIWAGDFAVTQFNVPFRGMMEMGIFAVPFTLLFIVWMTNLYNFMDGMDGFAGGMAVIGFGFLGALAFVADEANLGLLALVVAASAAGFLVFNFPPARIFMGDVGAVPLGFLAAALAVKGNREKVLGLWVPIIIFSPFIVDATVVLVRRILRRERIWQPHREHYYQRLVLAGWSHRKTVCAEYALMAVWGTVAVVYKWLGEEVGHAVILVLGAVVYSLLAFGVNRVEQRARREAERAEHRMAG